MMDRMGVKRDYLALATKSENKNLLSFRGHYNSDQHSRRSMEVLGFRLYKKLVVGVFCASDSTKIPQK